MKLTYRQMQFTSNFILQKMDGYRKHRLQIQCSELKNDPLGTIKRGGQDTHTDLAGHLAHCLVELGNDPSAQVCTCRLQPRTSKLTIKSFKEKKKKKSEPHQPDTRPIKGEVDVITRCNMTTEELPSKPQRQSKTVHLLILLVTQKSVKLLAQRIIFTFYPEGGSATGC